MATKNNELIEISKLVDVPTYAKNMGISPQAVTKQIRANKPLKNVKKVLNFARFYVLVIE